jgi:uncharacterized protein involved in exopolysaccharide biosynthesis
MQDPPVARSEGTDPGALSGFDYVLILYQQKWLIIGALVICLAAAYAFIRISVTRYEATVLMVPYSDQVGNVPSGAAGTLAGLGLLGRAATNEIRAVALATLDSRSLLQQFITDNNLLPVLFAERWDSATGNWKSDQKAPSLEDGYKRLFGLIRIEEDTTRNVIRLHVRWTDASVAAAWANGLVQRVNARMQAKEVGETTAMISYLNDEYRRTTVQELRTNIASLIEDEIKKGMMAKSHDDFALVVIDPAEPTESPASPRVLVIMAGGALFGLLIGVPGSFFRHGLQLRKRADRLNAAGIASRSREEGWRTS